MQLGYLVDLSTVKLDDSAGSWMMLMPSGTYQHPLYGKLDFTSAKFDVYKKNFDDKIRGIEVDIDYDHKEDVARGSAAAGWLRQVDNRGDQGLWGLVEWTPAARQAIKNGEFRYFSPEFADEWKDAQGTVHKDVIFGGGLTNRPFLKDILPINLSEAFLAAEQKQPIPTGGQMDELKKLVEKLNLAEGSDEAAIEAAVDKLLEDLAEAKKTPPTPPKEEEQEDDAELVALSEKNPAMKRLLAERAEDRKRLAALEASNKLTEVKLQVRTLGDTGAAKGRSLGKAQQDKLEELLVGSSAQLSEKIVKLFEELLEGGFVELNEQGTRKLDTDGKDATKAFTDKVTEIRKADEKLSYADAVELAIADDPELWVAHSSAVWEGAES